MTDHPLDINLVPVITVWEPWASFLMPHEHREPCKRHETTSWPAPKNLMGKTVAIHSACRVPPENLPLMVEMLAEAHWGAEWRTTRHYGCILGTAHLDECYPAFPGKSVDNIDAILGNWAMDRWAWKFTEAKALPIPVPAKGKQGVWYINANKITTMRPRI